MKYTCPVCGFDELQEPPKSWSICPCCLTEFEYSDASWTHAELRQDWIDGGAKWEASYVPKPANWSPVSQLRNIGYRCTVADLQKIRGGEAVLTPLTVVIMADNGDTGDNAPAVKQMPLISVTTATTRVRTENYSSINRVFPGGLLQYA